MALLPRIPPGVEPRESLERRVHLEEDVVAGLPRRVEDDAVVGEPLRHVPEQRFQLLFAALERVGGGPGLGALQDLPVPGVADQGERVLLHAFHELDDAQLHSRRGEGGEDVEPADGLHGRYERSHLVAVRAATNDAEAVEAGEDRPVELSLECLVRPRAGRDARRRRHDLHLSASHVLREGRDRRGERPRHVFVREGRMDLPRAQLVALEPRPDERNQQFEQLGLRCVEDGEVATPRQIADGGDA